MCADFASPKRRRVQVCLSTSTSPPATPVDASKAAARLSLLEDRTPEGKPLLPGGGRSSWAPASEWIPKTTPPASPPAACVPATALLTKPAQLRVSLVHALRAEQSLLAGHVAEYLWSVEERRVVVGCQVITRRQASRDLWELVGASREVALEVTVGIKNRRRDARFPDMIDELRQRLPRRIWADSRKIREVSTSTADRNEALSVLRDLLV